MSNNGKLHVVLMMAAAIPIETHLERLSKAINDFVSNNSEENKQNLQMCLQLTQISLTTDGKIEEALKMGDKIEEVQKREQIFNVNKN